MTLEKGYRYLFYKLYRFYERAPSVWWSDWKASFSLMVLEVWLLLSFMVYYKVITKRDLIPDNRLTIVSITVVVILSAIKYFVFEHQNRWKEYVEEFTKLPKKKNRIGTLIVWLIVLFILGNLVFSFFLLRQIDWTLYR